MALDVPVLRLSEQSFGTLRMLFERESGIRLRDEKRTLVVSRLQARLEQRGMRSMEDYCALLLRPAEQEERQRMVDALTTHETYFFREPRHFEHLAQQALPALTQRPLRIWSAASSTGEEAYSLAMILAEALGPAGWELLGSDISTRVLEVAQRGLYALNRLECMPRAFLQKYCRRGFGPYEGQLLINSSLRARTRFLRHNLLDASNPLGMFDVIFLRNVLIYFDPERRRYIVRNMISRLNPGGFIYFGSSESVSGSTEGLESVASSVFRRPMQRMKP